MNEFEKSLIRDTDLWLCDYYKKRVKLGIIPTFARLRQCALKRFPISPSLFDDNIKLDKDARIWKIYQLHNGEVI